MASHLSRVFFRTYHTLLYGEVALVFLSLFIRFHNRPSPSDSLFRENRNLRTIIVIADIDRGLCSASTSYCYKVPTTLDLPALVRHHPLYFLLRVCRELCFW